MESREFVEGISYAKFAALAKQMQWSIGHLAESLRGTFEVEGETFEHYFERVLHGDPSAEVVIPFRARASTPSRRSARGSKPRWETAMR
jgi:hypothetical protein